MSVFLEILGKSQDQVAVYFEKQPTDIVSSVNIYVSMTDVTANYAKVIHNVTNAPSAVSGDSRNVYFKILLEDLQGLGGGFANASFEGTPLYLRATTVAPGGIESAVSGALTKFLGVVGYNPLPEQDNPAENTHPYSFSTQTLSWQRSCSTAHGAGQVSHNPYYEDNIVVDRTIVGGFVTKEVFYPAGSISGARAKQILYTAPFATDGRATKVEYSDITLP